MFEANRPGAARLAARVRRPLGEPDEGVGGRDAVPVPVPGDADDARADPGQALEAQAGAVRVDRQPGDEGGTDARGGQAQDGGVVVGPEGDLVPQLRPAEPVLDGVHLPHLRVRDQRHPVQVPRGHRRGTAGQLGILRHGQHVGILEQFHRLERAWCQREDHEGQVELAPFEVGEQVAVVLHLAEPHLDLRPGGGELTHDRRQQPRPRRSGSSRPAAARPCRWPARRGRPRRWPAGPRWPRRARPAAVRPG